MKKTPSVDLETAMPEYKSGAKQSSNKNNKKMIVLESENDLMMETEENLFSNDLNKDSLEDEINNMKLSKRKPKR